MANLVGQTTRQKNQVRVCSPWLICDSSTGDGLFSLCVPVVKAIKIPLLCWNIG